MLWSQDRLKHPKEVTGLTKPTINSCRQRTRREKPRLTDQYPEGPRHHRRLTASPRESSKPRPRAQQPGNSAPRCPSPTPPQSPPRPLKEARGTALGRRSVHLHLSSQTINQVIAYTEIKPGPINRSLLPSMQPAPSLGWDTRGEGRATITAARAQRQANESPNSLPACR